MASNKTWQVLRRIVQRQLLRMGRFGYDDDSMETCQVLRTALNDLKCTVVVEFNPDGLLEENRLWNSWA